MAFAAASSSPSRVTSAQVPLLPMVVHSTGTERKKKKEKRRRSSSRRISGGNESKSHGRPLLVTLRIEIVRRGLFRLVLLASLVAASFHLLHVHRTTLLSTAMTAAVLLRFGSDSSSRPEPRQGADHPPTPPKIPKLTVGIATVPREEKYLLATLDSWLRQLPVDPGDALYNSVRIVVMNAAPDRKHRWLDRAKKKYSPPHPMSSYVVFVDKDAAHPPVEDPKPGVMDEGDANVPGYRVRRQTRDIVALMRHSAVIGGNVTTIEVGGVEGEGEGEGGGVGSGSYFLFSEDDMELCDHGLSAVRRALAKSELRFGRWRKHNHGEKPPPDGGDGGDDDDGGKGFVALRVSFGMNGILLHHDGPGSSPDDVRNLADYLEEHQVRRPPDHLAVEWFGGETDQSALQKNGRVNAAFRYNLFNHLGVSSTLREEKSNAAHFPGCYEELGEPVLFEVESFDFGSCPPDEDLWPCPPPPAAAADAEAAIARADRDEGTGEEKEDRSEGGKDSDDRLEKYAIPTIAWGRLCTSGKRCLNVKNPARRRMEASAAAKAKAEATTTTTTGEAVSRKHQPPASLVAAVAKYRP